MLKKVTMVFAMFAVVCMSNLLNAAVVGPYTPDANTRMLFHLDQDMVDAVSGGSAGAIGSTTWETGVYGDALGGSMGYGVPSPSWPHAFTYETLIKPNSDVGGFIFGGNTGSGASVLYCAYDGANDAVNFGLGAWNMGGWVTGAFSGVTIEQGFWTHVALTSSRVDDDTLSISLYINNSLIGANEVSGAQLYSSNLGAVSGFYLGACPWDTNALYDAVFDEVRVSDIARTDFIPEPATMGLLSLGGLYLIRKRL